MATQSVKDILNTEVPSPSFVLDASAPSPIPSFINKNRGSKAWSHTERRQLEEVSGDKVRTVAYPITVQPQGYLMETGAYQMLSSGNDFANGATTVQLTPRSGQGTLKGHTYRAVDVSNDSSQEDHYLKEALSATGETGKFWSTSVAVDPSGGENYFYFRMQTADSNSTTNGDIRAWFDMRNAEVGTTKTGVGGQIKSYTCHPYIGSFVRCNLVIDLDAGWYPQNYLIGPAAVDGDIFFQGDGSRSFDLMYAQSEINEQPTSWILDGNYTRKYQNLDVLTSDIGFQKDGGSFYFEVTPMFDFVDLTSRFFRTDLTTRLEFYPSGPSTIQFIGNGASGPNLETGLSQGYKDSVKVVMTYDKNGYVKVYTPFEEASMGSDADVRNISTIKVQGSSIAHNEFRYYPQHLSDNQARALVGKTN